MPIKVKINQQNIQASSDEPQVQSNTQQPQVSSSQEVNEIKTELRQNKLSVSMTGSEIGRFTQLGDTPSSYADQAGKAVVVKQTEDGVEFSEVQTETVWGDITGTLSNQEDLQQALDNKADTGDLTAHIDNTNNPHNVTAGQLGAITTETDPIYTADKPTILNDNDDISRLTNDAGYITGFTETDPIWESEKSGYLQTTHLTDFSHADIALNTADRHNHTNKSILDAIQESLTTALKGNYDTAYSHSQITTGNPHSVTKADVGLADVPNLDTADAVNRAHDAATAGTGISITGQEVTNTDLGSSAVASHVLEPDPHPQYLQSFTETDPVWESEKGDYQKANITDTKDNILALTPTAGLVAYATDTDELLFADGSNWKNHVHTQYLQTTTADTTYLKLDASNSPSVSISRDVDGVIDEWTTGGTTYTPTYNTGLMTSYTDGTSTWTISRDGNNRITGVTKS